MKRFLSQEPLSSSLNFPRKTKKVKSTCLQMRAMPTWTLSLILWKFSTTTDNSWSLSSPLWTRSWLKSPKSYVSSLTTSSKQNPPPCCLPLSLSLLLITSLPLMKQPPESYALFWDNCPATSTLTNKKVSFWSFSECEGKAESKKCQISVWWAAWFTWTSTSPWQKFSWRTEEPSWSLMALRTVEVKPKCFITLFWMSGCYRSLISPLRNSWPSPNSQFSKVCAQSCRNSPGKSWQELPSWSSRMLKRTKSV